jgi:adenylate kinase
MGELRTEFFNTPLRDKFRRPIFRITALYVDEVESVRRQLQRGQKVRQHNRLVELTGQGDPINVRPTDYDEAVCYLLSILLTMLFISLYDLATKYF